MVEPTVPEENYDDVKSALYHLTKDDPREEDYEEALNHLITEIDESKAANAQKAGNCRKIILKRSHAL